MRTLFRHITAHAPTLTLLVIVGAIVALAATGRLVHNPTHSQGKEALLASLETVDNVALDPGIVMLYAGDTPLMAVWTGTFPAELYAADGTFAGRLTDSELEAVLDVTDRVPDLVFEPLPEVPRANSPLIHTI